MLLSAVVTSFILSPRGMPRTPSHDRRQHELAHGLDKALLCISDKPQHSLMRLSDSELVNELLYVVASSSV